MSTSALEGSRILVTGAAGFVGYHMSVRLLGLGARVIGVDCLTDYYEVALKEARLAELAGRSGFAFHRQDIADHDAMAALFASEKPDAVIHLAAQAGVRHSISHPQSYVSANLDGFLSILEACRHHRVRHLIYASSSSVYGANRKVPFHEDDPVLAPVSLYAATKRANELMAQTYAHLYRIPASGLRFFTVYGPWGRPDMAYFSFTKAILEGRPIDLFNHGRMQRDFTYVDDVTEAIARLVSVPPDASTAPDDPQAGAPHRLYNIGNHTPVELSRFVAAIETALGTTAEKRLLPMQAGDVPATYADVARLQAATGFAPDTSIEEGIARFVAWYRGFYRV